MISNSCSTARCSPTFLDQIVTVAAGQKITVVAEGDAAYHTTTFGIFTMPVYQTPVGIRAVSVLNASPNAGTLDFWYSCPAPALCGDGTNAGTAIGTGITVGTPGKVTTSWKTNFLLKSSTTGTFCFGAYVGAAIIPESQRSGRTAERGGSLASFDYGR